MGHGHVIPNKDGSLARCGGPAICTECARELKSDLYETIDALRLQIEALELTNRTLMRRIESLEGVVNP